MEAPSSTSNSISRRRFGNLIPQEDFEMTQRFVRQGKLMNDLFCVDCFQMPLHPVTGACGHTRCMACIRQRPICLCGRPSPKKLHVNVFIRNLLQNMFKDLSQLENPEVERNLIHESTLSTTPSISTSTVRTRRTRHVLRSNPYPPVSRESPTSNLQTQMTLPERSQRCLQEALGHIQERDLECIICCHLLRRPVTIPCGHLFCRICVKRILVDNFKCPLCSYNLRGFQLSKTADTKFVAAAVRLLEFDALDNAILIFTCTVAYPTISCPLLICEPRCWGMVKKVLESGSRRFGMVTFDSDRNRYYCGTLLEIRDCVLFEDGRTILSTVGVSRFKVLQREMTPEGCYMANVEELKDHTPTVSLNILQDLIDVIAKKAMEWISKLNEHVIEEIETAFGKMPSTETTENWWLTPNGPAFLWWLINIMPLQEEIKIQVLSTDSLYKRMLAIRYMFDLIIQISPIYDKNYTIESGPFQI